MTQDEIVRATDVYGITRDLPLNYVPRNSVDNELVSALTREQHLIIYGSSKQGKTCVRKYHLRDDECIVITASNRWTLSQLHSAILKQAGYTVVQTETRSVSGTYKISATASISARIFGTGAQAGLGGEKERENNSEVVEARLELDPVDVNDIIMALKEIFSDKWIVIEDFHGYAHAELAGSARGLPTRGRSAGHGRHRAHDQGKRACRGSDQGEPWPKSVPYSLHGNSPHVRVTKNELAKAEAGQQQIHGKSEIKQRKGPSYQHSTRPTSPCAKPQVA